MDITTPLGKEGKGSMIDTNNYVQDVGNYLTSHLLRLPSKIKNPGVPANANINDPNHHLLEPRFQEATGAIRNGYAQTGNGTHNHPMPNDVLQVAGFGPGFGPYNAHFKIFKTNPNADQAYVNIYRAHVANAVPCYYLPWVTGKVTWLTLLPGAAIDYFFTSTLSGCSIYVSGPHNAPTIYHTNAQHIQGAAAHIPGSPKEAYMDALANLAALTVGHNAAARRLRLTPATYVAGGTAQAGQAKATKKHKGIFGSTGRNVTATDFAYANLIGIRLNGQWNFYWQTRVDVSYTRPRRDIIANIRFGRAGQKVKYATGGMPAWS